MKLAKKGRIRAKQIARNKARHDAMTDTQKDRAFAKVHKAVKGQWTKRGFNFNRNTL